MQADPVAWLELCNLCADPFHYSSNLVPKGQRKRTHLGSPRPIMCI